MLDNEVDGPDHAVQGDFASIPAPGETRASPSVTTQVDLDALTVLPPAINPHIKSAAAGTADEKPVAGQQPRLTPGATTGAVLDVKAKRREQNRINAARSRQRNKGFIQQLKAQLQASQRENEALRLASVEMLRLRSENEKLRDFVAAFKAASQGVGVGAIASAAHQQGMFKQDSFDFSVPGFGNAGSIPYDPTSPVTAAALSGAMAQQGLMSHDSFELPWSVSDTSCNTSSAPTDTHSFILPTHILPLPPT